MGKVCEPLVKIVYVFTISFIEIVHLSTISISHTLKIEKNYTGSILTIIQEKINISVTTLLQKLF